MKTILYNPIFINPQAYYVFPQLYDIEKGDSFIEPAVYSGYLLIEDLVSNTSSQVTDTREVDFTQFADKRIRISQYTNIGAVVLGEWLLPEFDGKVTIPEPDVYYDLSLKDNSSPTRNIIDDLSGNGHDAEIFNATYSNGSGYGDYAVDFTKYKGNNTTSNSISIHKEAGINKGYATIAYSHLTSNIPSYSIEIKGLVSGQVLYYYRNNEGLEKNVPYNKDGIYKLPICYAEGTSGTSTGFTIDTVNEITITQIPDYDGAFVFDGVDDYAIMQNVTKGFKTLFMEVVPSLTTDKSGFLYDQRVGQTSFGISISLNHIAYNAYNWGGVTYINGKLNTTMNGKEVYQKHQIITIVNGTDLKPQKVVLGGDIGLDGYFSNMALYKLIGFYDELTPLQIEKVINDYKLKYD